MTEQNESLIDTLSKVSTFDDLKAALPQTITERLGKGEEGVNRALRLIIGLAPFAPEPATFGRDAFDAIVAFNEEANEPLSPEESQKMIDVALESGFLKRAPTEKERYIPNPQIKPLIERLLK